ncbi:MAG TPA: choice-of-anchor tandem repeat GloVer-containing protein [Candidatus Tumulicola sp.]|jgi:uncharacterized repeat protein (TIGR03803 family)
MSISTTSRYALSLSAAAALLAGCGGSQPPLSLLPEGLAPPQSLGTPAYRILHEFGKSAGDGANPAAPLINVRGTLYGTTPYGGSNNVGTVFAITKTGEETVLHSFTGAAFSVSADGAQPTTGLVNVNGTLYGTTSTGGANMCGGGSCGTVFSVTTSGKETVLHSFAYSTTDGAGPAAGLIDVGGILYGTTYAGGAHLCGGTYCGTVFSITTSGTEKLLYSFGQTNDGIYPQAALLDVGGTLYGTTSQGGKNKRGTVFTVSTTGHEQVLYSFGAVGFRDGTNPSSALVNAGGTLYGTTEQGGNGSSGAVYSITKFGRENLVYSFNGKDGSQPIGGVIDVKGVLYGTTYMGGAKNVGSVFSVTKTGQEEVVHSFRAGSGKNPIAGLLDVNGTLYGTTVGSIYDHHGNVFSLTP